MSSGIFSLNEAHNEQVTGDWSKASDVWLIGSPVVSEEGSPYGYFAGAKDPGGTAERLDYKNDSVTCIWRGNVRYAGNASAVANQSYG